MKPSGVFFTTTGTFLLVVNVVVFFSMIGSSSVMALATAAAATTNNHKKAVLVTGATRGIGLELCRCLLRDDHQEKNIHVVLGSRSLEKGEQVVKQLLQELEDTLDLDCKDRLMCVEMDTSSDESVARAAQQIQAVHPQLYGIVNNAGIIRGVSSCQDVMNTNYWGPRRVNDALTKLLLRPGGRIVNIASASGPNWLSRLSNDDQSLLKSKLAQPWTISGGIQELDEMARTIPLSDQDVYGISKAFLNAYTTLHAQSEHPDLIINSVTPGFIATDMGAALGATNPVSMGVKCPLYALLDEELAHVPTGRYYGSDCQRSPLDVYRGPGDPVYTGPDWIDAAVKSSTK